MAGENAEVVRPEALDSKTYRGHAGMVECLAEEPALRAAGLAASDAQ